MKSKLKIKQFSSFMKAKNNKIQYERNVKENQKKKEEGQKEYEISLEQTKNLTKEKESLQKEKESAKKEISENLIKDCIEEAKLKKELKELEAQNNLEKIKAVTEKDIALKNLENEKKVLTLEKEHKYVEMQQKMNIDIKRLELKYKCLKDEIYDGTEYDELIDVAEQKKNEVINNELEYFKEQKKELEKFRENTDKKLQNLKYSNENEIQKKFLELQNHKLKEYNKLLLEKNKMFNDFKVKFSINKTSNEILKNKEIENAKMFYEQQKYNLGFREQVFNTQKQNINAFIKQLEINDDEYSKYILNLLK